MPKSKLNFAAISAQQKVVERIADEWIVGRADEAALDDATEKLQRLCGAPIGSTKVVASHDRPWAHTTKSDAYRRQLEARQHGTPTRVTVKPQGSAKSVPPAKGAPPAKTAPAAQGQRARLQAYQQRAQSAQARLQAHEVAEARRVAQEQVEAAQQRAARIAALKERLRDEAAQKQLAALWRFQRTRID